MRASLPWFIMAHFGHHLIGALPMPLMPAIRTGFGLNNFQTTLVTTLFSLAGGAGNIPAGRMADKIGPTIDDYRYSRCRYWRTGGRPFQ